MKPGNVVLRFEREVRAAVEAAELLDQRLILAVSGGPDSLATLYSLHRLRDDFSLTLHVGHLNHQLRGQASVEDAEFVVAECEKLNVPCTVEEADVRGFQQEHRLSLEEAAREVRYAFLARLAECMHADAIALGHTADDHVETVLMNVIRGTGLQGLRGIQQVSRRQIDGVDVALFRPILSLSKSDTLEYCRTLGLRPREDESNRSVQLTRNRVRLELLPLLEQVNPAVRDAIVRLSRNATEAITVVDQAVDEAWSQAVTEADGLVSFDRKAFTELEPAMRAGVARRALSIVRGSETGIERVNVEDIVNLIVESGGQLHLPDGIFLEVGPSSAVLSTAGRLPHEVPLPEIEETQLPPAGITIAGDWRITTKPVEGGAEPSEARVFDFAPDGLIARVRLATFLEGATVRARMPGDRFQPLGMSGTKKLKDYMIDEKIPQSWRDRVPLVVTPTGIAWVVGWRIAHWAKVHQDDTECMEIGFERID